MYINYYIGQYKKKDPCYLPEKIYIIFFRRHPVRKRKTLVGGECVCLMLDVNSQVSQMSFCQTLTSNRGGAQPRSLVGL